MKIVKLTQKEIDVILEGLFEKQICLTRCYCNYKAPNMCEKTDKNGNPSCELKKIIKSIKEKLLKGTE